MRCSVSDVLQAGTQVKGPQSWKDKNMRRTTKQGQGAGGGPSIGGPSIGSPSIQSPSIGSPSIGSPSLMLLKFKARVAV